MNIFNSIILLAILITVTIAHGQTFSDSSSLLNPLANNDNQEGGTWGASAADFNNDGLVDIFHEGRLYLNEGSMGFNDIIASAGEIDITTYGAIFGDYNNDGYLDVFMEDPNIGGANYLHRNNKKRAFIAVDAETHMDEIPGNAVLQGCAWGDFNRDGRLDLFIGEDFGRNRLFKNVDNETFEDITTPDIQNNNRSYGLAWGDFNNDLYPDMFVAPCHPFRASQSVKHLYLNNGDETFTDINVAAGVNDSLASWGIIWLNYNNDEYLDVFIANTEHNPRPGYNKLYRNNGDNTFTDVSDSAGISGDFGENSFGTGAGDFDNDGWIDIYVANQFQSHRLYKNNGDGTFSDIADAAGILESNHKAVALADYNNDGWLDIFSAGAPANRLMLNDGGANNWIIIKLRGVSSNHFGIGARIEVYSAGMMQQREVNSGDSFCSQNDNLNIHVGLAGNTTIDSIIVKWPGGLVDIVNNVSSNQRITIVEGMGINNAPSSFKTTTPGDNSILSSFDNPFTWQQATNAEAENVFYNLYIYNANFDTVISNIPDSTISINLSSLIPGQSYNWLVDASDGYSITASLNSNSFTMDSQLSLTEKIKQIPSKYSLSQNYPNPFNPGTTIQYSIAKTAHVALKIFDTAGKEIAVLVNTVQSANTYTVNFDATQLASGIYIYSLFSDNDFISSKKMIILQ